MAVVSGESLLSGAVYYTSPPSETRQPHIHGRAQLPQLNLAKERSVQPWQDGSKGKTRPQDLSSIWLWVVGICGEDYRGLRFSRDLPAIIALSADCRHRGRCAAAAARFVVAVGRGVPTPLPSKDNQPGRVVGLRPPARSTPTDSPCPLPPRCSPRGRG